MGEHDEQAEYERRVGQAVIENARQRDAAALALWERNRQFNFIGTVFAVVVMLVLAFITDFPLYRWSVLSRLPWLYARMVISGCC